MSTFPDASVMVNNYRYYGTGLNIGALYGRMKIESDGNPNRWYSIRISIMPHVSAHELDSIDSIYNSENPFANVVPTPVPSPAPILVYPIVTTPTDASGLVFPSPDAPMEEQVAFYQSSAYLQYIAERQKSTAGYGFDSIFDNYVLNSVISYQANNNLNGAIGYMQQISAYHNQQLSTNMVDSVKQKGYSITPSEASYLLSGGQLTMVRNAAGDLVSIDRLLDTDAITVTAPRISNPPPGYTSVGFLSMLSTGVSLIPAAIVGGSAPDESSTYRALTATEKSHVDRIFGGSVDVEKVAISFGAGFNMVAKTAFLKGHPAITLGNTIYFNSSPRALNSVRDFALLAHEMTHVRQFQTKGWFNYFGGHGVEGSIAGEYSYEYYKRNLGYKYEFLEGQAQIVEDLVRYRESSNHTLPSYITAERLEILAEGSGVYGK